MKTEAMSTPLAIFTCRPTSHPFQERHIIVSEPVKIGRSVARARPAANNAIFDCKVLSRNHALLWCEDNKFFLQDTKSSNGTFVNSQRLSKGAEESQPREIFSGDIIQFGVDVMENSRRVTHGCIIATVTLINSDGSEAKPTYDNSGSTLCSQTGTAVSSQELYQLSQYLQEALQREQMMESKLATLQRLLDNTQKASESSWQALIDEDRLLSRLESLQSQLASYTKAQTEGSLLEQLAALHMEKANYECTAKDTLRKVLEEKLEAVQKLTDLERSLSNAEEECSHARRLYESARSELASLADAHDQKISETHELHEKLKETQKSQEEELQRHEEDLRLLRERIEDLQAEKKMLATRVEELLSENDLAHEELNSVQDANRKNANLLNDGSLTKEMAPTGLDESDANVDVGQFNSREVKPAEALVMRGVLRERADECQMLQQKLAKALSEVAAYEERLELSEAKHDELVEHEHQLQKQLEQAQLQVVEYITKVATLEEKLRQSDGMVSLSVETACTSLRLQLGEALAQGDRAADRVRSLEDDIEKIKSDRDAHEVRVLALQQELDKVHCSQIAQADRLSEAQGAVESAKSEVQELKAALEVQQEKNFVLNEQLDSAKTDLQIAKSRTQELESAMAELKAVHSELVVASAEWQRREHSLSEELATACRDASSSKDKLGRVEDELAQQEQKCARLNEDVMRLNACNNSLSEELSVLSSRSHVISLCSLGPLLLLFFAIGMALHPSLSWLTATTDP